jgi:hypothetical protein
MRKFGAETSGNRRFHADLSELRVWSRWECQCWCAWHRVSFGRAMRHCSGMPQLRVLLLVSFCFLACDTSGKTVLKCAKGTVPCGDGCMPLTSVCWKTGRPRPAAATAPTARAGAATRTRTAPARTATSSSAARQDSAAPRTWTASGASTAARGRTTVASTASHFRPLAALPTLATPTARPRPTPPLWRSTAVAVVRTASIAMPATAVAATCAARSPVPASGAAAYVRACRRRAAAAPVAAGCARTGPAGVRRSARR